MRTSSNQSIRLWNILDGSSRGISRGGVASSYSNNRDVKDRLKSQGMNSSSAWNYTGNSCFFQDQGVKEIKGFKSVNISD